MVEVTGSSPVLPTTPEKPRTPSAGFFVVGGIGFPLPQGTRRPLVSAPCRPLSSIHGSFLLTCELRARAIQCPHANQQLNALNQILTLSLRLRLCLSLALLLAMSWQASAQMLGVSVEVDTVFGGPSPDFDPNGELEGYTSYLIYANFTNPTDVLSAVFADTEAFEGTAVLGIDAPCGCFNPDEGSMVIGSFVNSNFSNIPQFALYQYDTFWTIGQEFSDDAGTTPDWVSFPPIDGSNICEEEVNNGTMFITGSTGSWPVNAVAGNDLKILIARVTTCGEFTFTMNAQVFVEGLQSNPELFTMCEFADFDLDGIVFPYPFRSKAH